VGVSYSAGELTHSRPQLFLGNRQLTCETCYAPERALPPVVIWRRTSFGSQSQAGRQTDSRMLTVSTSLKAKIRLVLEVLPHACRAA